MTGARLWKAALEAMFVTWAWYDVCVEKRGWDPDWFWGVLAVVFLLALIVPAVTFGGTTVVKVVREEKSAQ